MGNLPKITKWRRNGDPAVRTLSGSWDTLSGQVVQMVGNQRKILDKFTTNVVVSCISCGSTASLPSKFVVFSPNGEMEKGASASALDITSRDETDWHHRPGWSGLLYT